MEIGPRKWEHDTEILARVRERERPDRPLVLLRHAEREDMRNLTVEQAILTPLTERGRARARRFGAGLPPERVLRLFHSPVPRCEDTAERIAEGFGEAGGTVRWGGPRHFLGAPFIREPISVAMAFGKLGHRGFMRAWLAGEIKEPVIDSPDRAGQDLFSALADEQGAGDDEGLSVLDVHVGHDVSVVSLLHLLADLTDPDLPWPGYLDGVVLETRETPYRWWYRDLTGTIDP